MVKTQTRGFGFSVCASMAKRRLKAPEGRANHPERVLTIYERRVKFKRMKRRQKFS